MEISRKLFRQAFRIYALVCKSYAGSAVVQTKV